eukprot:3878308-Pleurochrysis_carterae.AAC.1
MPAQSGQPGQGRRPTRQETEHVQPRRMKPSTARAETSNTSNASPRRTVGEAARMPCATSRRSRGE